MSQPPKADALAERLAKIEEKLDLLLGSRVTGFVPQTLPLSTNDLQLRVSLNRETSGRKPFKLAIDGAIRYVSFLSDVRSAVLLISFLDLQNRLEGGTGLPDPILEMQRTLVALTGKERSPHELNESIRVGIYRTAKWIEDNEHFATANVTLRLDPSSGKFEVGERSSNSVRIRFTSEDQVISRVADELLGLSPLARLRRSKASYYVPGTSGHDRLIMEFVDHQQPLTLHSLYSRPVTHSYPLSLLRLLKVTPERIRRAELTQAGYRTGRVRCVEIMNRGMLSSFFSADTSGNFSMYRGVVSSDHVRGHLDHLCSLLKSFEAYSVVLTDAVLPFMLGTYKIGHPEAAEHFVMFYQGADAISAFNTGSFVLADKVVYEAVEDKIIRWILEHPTTQANREEVIGELVALRAAI